MSATNDDRDRAFSPGLTLYRWPESARVGRTVPKSKFYEHGNVTAAVKRHFVDDVESITWAYKLAPETIGLAATEAVSEVQVFTITLKPGRDTLDNRVLAAINGAIPTAIIFEVEKPAVVPVPSGVEPVETPAMVSMAAAPQVLGRRVRLEDYWTTPVQPQDAPRVPLPPAADLERLYTALLAPTAPIVPQAGETLAETHERATRIAALDREIGALARKLRAEKQLNRQMDLRRQLRAVEKERQFLGKFE
ncbi:MAG: DUF4391 domain-containing protein [Cellulomonadaceae bacterium]|nr:DUF4391 domain-containing protein [Cellulomonadaceae bacterium]